MYFKVLNNSLKHHGFQYKLGLNIDTNSFNKKEFENGLYFCSLKQVPLWMRNDSKLAFVSIPNDAKVVHFRDKSKANKIFIHRIIDFENWEMWENEEFCLNAVKRNGCFLGFVKNQTEVVCLEAVKQTGYALLFVKNQTETVALEAVKQNGIVLQDVKNQTGEICLEAVKQNGYALRYVRNQTKSVCFEAVKQTVLALIYVENRTVAWKLFKNIVFQFCNTIMN
jgi:hypothetical protein